MFRWCWHTSIQDVLVVTPKTCAHTHTELHVNLTPKREAALLPCDPLHVCEKIDDMKYSPAEPYLSSKERASVIATSQHEDINLRSKVHVLPKVLKHTPPIHIHCFLLPLSVLLTLSLFTVANGTNFQILSQAYLWDSIQQHTIQWQLQPIQTSHIWWQEKVHILLLTKGQPLPHVNNNYYSGSLYHVWME